MSFNTGGHVVYLKEPQDTQWVLTGDFVFTQLPGVLEGLLGENILGFLSTSKSLVGALSADAGFLGIFSEEPLSAHVSEESSLSGVLKFAPKLFGRVSSESAVSGSLSISSGQSVMGALATSGGLAGMIGIGETTVSGDISDAQGVTGVMSNNQSTVGEIT